MKKIKPIRSKKLTYDQLPETHKLAIDAALDNMEPIPGHWTVRVETYKTQDVIGFMRDEWLWTTDISEVRSFNSTHDAKRIEKIMRLIPKQGKWPYVSYWADDLEELRETTAFFSCQIRSNTGELSDRTNP